jgi:N6-adenosine-specific RNA methylase IME4
MMRVDEIHVGRHHRKDLGNLDALADSIRELGLLQPLTVTPDRRLVAGERRMAAVRLLGWADVPVHVVRGLDDALQLLRAERDENTCRKDFAPSEAVALGQELEELERRAARERQAAAGPAGGKGRKPSGSGKLPEAVKGDTRDKVGAALGMSGRTYEKAKAVVEAAQEDPDGYGDLAEEMDQTGKVDAAHQKLKGRRQRKANAVTHETCIVNDLSELVRAGKRFGTIYADPPWQYDNCGTRAAASRHYETMSLRRLLALPVRELAAERCHLHLWATKSFLREGLVLLRRWGFEYRTYFSWVKPQLGIGNYWRSCQEPLLLGVKGDLTFPPTDFPDWLLENRGEHSVKPEKVRLRIEQVSPGPRLELFARRAAPGWTACGNEVERPVEAG